ncbi:MAG: hypothetical protein HC933_02165 [Pleurocapsa sp. SU_196_0]|nr:hypothetical protein [Pleurocapsa sp. SU_196_0]
MPSAYVESNTANGTWAVVSSAIFGQALRWTSTVFGSEDSAIYAAFETRNARVEAFIALRGTNSNEQPGLDLRVVGGNRIGIKLSRFHGSLRVQDLGASPTTTDVAFAWQTGVIYRVLVTLRDSSLRVQVFNGVNLVLDHSQTVNHTDVGKFGLRAAGDSAGSMEWGSLRVAPGADPVRLGLSESTNGLFVDAGISASFTPNTERSRRCCLMTGKARRYTAQT